MAVHFTVDEVQCLETLLHVYKAPNYNDRVRTVEGWLAKHDGILMSAFAKLRSPDALVSVEPPPPEPAPLPVPAPKKAPPPPPAPKKELIEKPVEKKAPPPKKDLDD